MVEAQGFHSLLFPIIWCLSLETKNVKPFSENLMNVNKFVVTGSVFLTRHNSHVLRQDTVLAHLYKRTCLGRATAFMPGSRFAFKT